MICKLGESVTLGKGLIGKKSINYRGIVSSTSFAITTLPVGAGVLLYIPMNATEFRFPGSTDIVKIKNITPQELDIEIG